MQLSNVSVAFLAVGLFALHADAITPKKASLVGHTQTHDKEMPIVRHDKTAGDGYDKGSPLYKKQEARKEEGIPAAKPADPKGASGGYSEVMTYFIVTLLLIAVGLIAFMFFRKVKNSGHQDEALHKKLSRHVSDAHLNASGSTTGHPQFRKMAGPPLCIFALIYGYIAYLALQYASEGSPGECPFPLAKLLFYYGCLVAVMAAIMICTIAYPPMVQAQHGAHSCCQCIGLVMLVLALLSYGQAQQCGKHVWWATLLLGSPLIGACVYCCCSPFGAAKAVAFVGYKAAAGMAVTKAPTYKAATTVLTQSA